MGILAHTALIIQSRDDLVVTHAGPNKNGKFRGWIILPPEQYSRPILHSEQLFDSSEDAEQHMHQLITEIRQLLSNAHITGS